MHTFVVLAYKKSKYLEDCVKSVLNQKYKSNVVIATSTENDYIKMIANKYSLDVIVNSNPSKGIGYDFDFAANCVNDQLVTIAHQDDIYDYDYSYEIVNSYKNNKNALIVFTDYYEIKGTDKVYTNKNLKIKRILLTPLKMKFFSSTVFGKRLVLRFGNSICCPAVTFAKERINDNKIFASNMKCNVDWLAWERLSKKNGDFVYINQCLMGHRVHNDSTTTEIINQGIRTKEDMMMFKKFWPDWISNIINKVYKYSEKNNG